MTVEDGSKTGQSSDPEGTQNQAVDQKPSKKKRVDITERIFELEAAIAERATTETLSTGSKLEVEEYTSPFSSLSGVAAHFGFKKTRSWLDAKITRLKNRFPKLSKAEEWAGPVGYSTGFGTIMRTPDNYTLEQRDSDTFEVALRLAKRAIEQKGWNAEDVDIVDFANSAADIGMSKILKKRLVEELGMKKDLEVTGTFMACDGAGRALFNRLTDQESVEKKKKVLLLSVDQVTSEMPLNPKQVDTYAMQLFSNGAAAIAYQVGVDFSLLTTIGENGEVEPIGTAVE
jgi:hypothetical protein